MGAPKGGGPNLEKMRPRRVGAPKGGAPKGGAPKGGAPKGGGPKGGGPKFRVFSSLSHHRFALSVPLWGSSRGILVVF